MTESQRKAYEMGQVAYARKVQRLGSHSQPCVLRSCNRFACKGYRDAQEKATVVNDRRRGGLGT